MRNKKLISTCFPIAKRVYAMDETEFTVGKFYSIALWARKTHLVFGVSDFSPLFLHASHFLHKTNCDATYIFPLKPPDKSNKV